MDSANRCGVGELQLKLCQELPSWVTTALLWKHLLDMRATPLTWVPTFTWTDFGPAQSSPTDIRGLLYWFVGRNRQASLNLPVFEEGPSKISSFSASVLPWFY